MLVIGWADNEDELVFIGLSLLVTSILTLIITLPLLRGFVELVESAEYTKANIADYYNIDKQEPQEMQQE